jgi:hypothetical protein
MSGIQARVISVLPFILVFRLTFFVGVQTDSHRTRQILFQDHLIADPDRHYNFIFSL